VAKIQKGNIMIYEASTLRKVDGRKLEQQVRHLNPDLGIQ